MRLKSPRELQQMSRIDLHVYRTQIWLKMHEDWDRAQKAAWAPLLRALERSNEGRAAIVVKQGGLTSGIVTVEFFQGDTLEDALVLLEIDRKNGAPPERYAPLPEELMTYLDRLGLEPYSRYIHWEAV